MAKLFLVIVGELDSMRQDERTGARDLGKYKPKKLHNDVDSAMVEAEDLAIKNHKKPIYIFEAIKTVETNKPKLVEKLFNAAGELIPRE